MLGEQSISAYYPAKIRTKALIFLALTVLAAYLPTIIHQQLITGPLVNMSLILAVFLVGPFEALVLGLLPSVFALTSGLLPLPLAPIVPFIMIGNAILVAVYHYLGKKRFVISIAIAGLLKFAFLYGTASLLAKFLFSGKAMPNLMAMMGWAQFFTAVLGGLMAYAILFSVKKFRQ
ncbi:MAG: hypothetical protein PHW33_03265 [Candidatus Portnoybacteria bacterium]|jgi:hypothetical protein|nr:hypothetical protein [Candidatus Portnoybacteria bacterium]